jgi:Na+/H+-translocating membrane pyrophosphatase
MRKKADEDCKHLQTYQVKPDYARCVSIVASASLREMIKPGALAVISPIVLGAY